VSLHLRTAALMQIFDFVSRIAGLERKAERRRAEQTAAIGNAATIVERRMVGASADPALLEKERPARRHGGSRNRSSFGNKLVWMESGCCNGAFAFVKLMAAGRAIDDHTR
jgi:hypothetical protein